MPASLIKTLIFTILVPGTVCVYVPYRLRGPGPYEIPSWAWLALIPALAGFAVYLWCAWDFATFGRGTPVIFDAPKRLVARGLYRWVRNPMYEGVLLMVLAQAILFRSAATFYYFSSAAVIFHLFVLLYEEPVLHRQFGESYDEYRRRVPRWLPKAKPGAGRVPAK